MRTRVALVALVAVAGPAAGAGRQRRQGRCPSTRRSPPRAAADAAPGAPAGEHTLGTGGHRCRARGRRGRLGDFTRTDHAAGHRGTADGHRRWRCCAVASDGAGAGFAPRFVGRAARRQAGTCRRDGQLCGRPVRVVPGRLHRLFAECRHLAGRGLGSAWSCGHAGTHWCWADLLGTARPRPATRYAPAERQDL